MSGLDSRLRSLLAWRLIGACEADAPDTSLVEVFDPIDGRTLVLSSGDHPCQLVLNGARGVTVLAPIHIETLPWADVAGRDIDILAAEVCATLGWDRVHGGQPNGTVMSHALVGRILASTSVESSEYWVSSLWSIGQDECVGMLHAFPTYEDTVLEQLEAAATSPDGTSGGEAWILWRDASPLALFDTDLNFHTSSSRWDYRELAIEVDFCPRKIAHYCLDVLLAEGPSKKIFAPPLMSSAVTEKDLP